MANTEIGTLTYLHFTVFDTDGVTPLSGQAGACTSWLSRNGAAAPEAVAIAEIGVSGHYFGSFTPLVAGFYDLEITCPDGRVQGEAYRVYTEELLNLSVLLEGAETLGEALRIIRSFSAGHSGGGGTATLNFEDLARTKNRIVANVDNRGNRLNVVTDGTP